MVLDRSVSSSIRTARSRLSDVLAQIRSGKIEEEYEYDDEDETDPDFASPPSKRRQPSSRYTTTAMDRRSRGDTDHTATLNAIHSTSKSIPATPMSCDQTFAPRTSGFILKLFDRTVDLAQFSHGDVNEDAPLYPVCRAWVHSQHLGHSNRRGKFSPPQELHESPDNNDEDSIDNVHQLPKPLERDYVIKIENNTDEKESGETSTTRTRVEIDLRIPESVRSWKLAGNVKELVDSALNGRQDEWNAANLMEINKQSWKKCREEWKRAAKINEARYAASARILKDIYLALT